MIATATTAGVWEISEAAYFADSTHVSSSMLELFRESIPGFAAVHVQQTQQAAPPTRDMLRGTALHALLLGGSFPSEVASERKSIEAWADAARRHPEVARMLDADGRTECVARWTDPDTGLPCKCKFDRVLKNGLITDFKTTRDPSPAGFAKSVANYGYHRRAAHYLAGAWHALGAEGPLVWVAVGKLPPFEVVIYTPAPQALERGRHQNNADLAELAKCHALDRWDSRHRGVIELDLPRWAFYD